MPDSYVKQNCCPVTLSGDKVDVFLEVCSITNVRSYVDFSFCCSNPFVVGYSPNKTFC